VLRTGVVVVEEKVVLPATHRADVTVRHELESADRAGVLHDLDPTRFLENFAQQLSAPDKEGPCEQGADEDDGVQD
jgi:hypothetical protein